MQLSFSKIKTFLSCPRRFKLSLEKPNFNGEAGEFGSKVHQAIEGTLKFGELPVFSPEEKPLATEMIKEATEYIGGLDCEVEQKFSLDENFKPTDWKDGYFRGIVDVMIPSLNGYEILDWKSGHKKPDRTQLMVYAYCMKKMGFTVTKAGYYMLRYSETVTYEVGENDINDAETWLKSVIKDIEKEKKFKPRPSRDCNYCAFQDTCPVVELETVTSKDDAVGMLRSIEILKNKKKRMTEKVHHFLMENGVILDVDGEQYGQKKNKNGKPYFGYLKGD